jgi:hypothetical protein
MAGDSPPAPSPASAFLIPPTRLGPANPQSVVRENWIITQPKAENGGGGLYTKAKYKELTYVRQNKIDLHF